MNAPHIIVMGVSGCGKSTVGAALAVRMNRPFLEGDDYHSDENVTKMASGIPLSNADRDGWIRALCKAANAGPAAIIACSALNATVRGWMLKRCARPLCFVYLHLDYNRLLGRLEQRPGHFMSAAMLDSQFGALEVPDDGMIVSGDAPVSLIVETVITALEAG